MTPKLKPCPFCGADVGYDSDMGHILCTGCGFFYEVSSSLTEEAPMWNRRPAVPVRGEAGLVKCRDYDVCSAGEKDGPCDGKCEIPASEELVEALRAWELVNSEMGDNHPCPDLRLRAKYRKRARELTLIALAKYAKGGK